jgi:aryl-alcohol dehydrogenase-like predicted oxidoreductase
VTNQRNQFLIGEMSIRAANLYKPGRRVSGDLIDLPRVKVSLPMRQIPGTALDVHPLCLGGNVFGWTSDEADSFAVLDAYVEAGGNFIDTADVYSAWVPEHSGGESETVIGNWIRKRGGHDDVVIATKVGSMGGIGGDNVRDKTADCLRRLGVEAIDLLYIHRDDGETPIDETLGALDELVRDGKVRYIAASNYSPERLTEALEASGRDGLARFCALQPGYNLVDREYEDDLEPVVAGNDLACIPYYGLASGFLTGKYRPGGERVDSPRGAGASRYLKTEHGPRTLETLDEIAAAHDTSLAAVALAWLAAQPTVLAPIASARNTEQLAELMAFTELELSEEELANLSAASAP